MCLECHPHWCDPYHGTMLAGVPVRPGWVSSSFCISRATKRARESPAAAAPSLSPGLPEPTSLSLPLFPQNSACKEQAPPADGCEGRGCSGQESQESTSPAICHPATAQSDGLGPQEDAPDSSGVLSPLSSSFVFFWFT